MSTVSLHICIVRLCRPKPGGHESLEYQVVKEFSQKLVILVENAGTNELLDELFQRDVIGLEKKRQIEDIQNTAERSRKLISLLQESVRFNPDQIIKILLDIMKSNAVYNDVRLAIERRYYKLRFNSKLKVDQYNVVSSYICYTGKLRGKRFNNFCLQFQKALLENNCRKLKELREYTYCTFTVEERLYFDCYYCLGLTHKHDEASIQEAIHILENIAHQTETSPTDNKDIIRGRAYRIMAGGYQKLDKIEEASDCIKKAITIHCNLEHGCEKACTFLEFTKIQQSDPNMWQTREKFEKELMMVNDFTQKCKNEARRPKMLKMVDIQMALFFLNPTKKDTFFSTDKCTSFSPSTDELDKAQKCLATLQLPELGQQNIYQVRWNTAMSDLHRHQKKYQLAHQYILEAHNLTASAEILREDCLKIDKKLKWLQLSIRN